MSKMKIQHKELLQFVHSILCAAGVSNAEAEIVSQVLVWCDLVGRYTQGVIRIPIFLRRFKLALIQSPCHPELIQKSEAICLIDGNNGFGQYLGFMAMSKAIEMADRCGIGMVGVSRSNHFSANAYYVQMAAERNKIGLAFTNGFPRTAPHGGISATLGTNPLGFAAPTRNKESILVDLSTGASSGSMIRQAIVEKRNIPEGILIDQAGNPVVDPLQAEGCTILPFGGAKGFCLSLMVEILSGLITGAGISHEVESTYKNFEKSSNSGHLFIAIDIPRVMGDMEVYYKKMDTLISFIKGAQRQNEVEEILLPGETRWRHYNQQLIEGIELNIETVKSLDKIANELSILTPWGCLE